MLFTITQKSREPPACDFPLLYICAGLFRGFLFVPTKLEFLLTPLLLLGEFSGYVLLGTANADDLGKLKRDCTYEIYH